MHNIPHSENTIQRGAVRSGSLICAFGNSPKNACRCISMFADHSVRRIGGKIEKSVRDSRNWPPHKYFAKPLYRSLTSRVNRPIATVCVFLACHLVFHQSLCSITGYISGKDIVSRSDLLLAVLWTVMGVTVAYKKYVTNSV